MNVLTRAQDPYEQSARRGHDLDIGEKSRQPSFGFCLSSVFPADLCESAVAVLAFA